ncbi:hypothetical protein C8J57DRAFT_1540043 [Mycena rebaudengoi]|nr:hypothetical protein C8J57DRAFT_1540043 [Mycena rebaudengoi]
MREATFTRVEGKQCEPPTSALKAHESGARQIEWAYSVMFVSLEFLRVSALVRRGGKGVPGARSQTRSYRSSGTSYSHRPRLAPRRLPEHLGYIPARIWLLTTGKPLPHLGRRLRAILPCTSAALTHLMVLAIYALADLGGPAPCATRGVLHQRTVYASRAWVCRKRHAVCARTGRAHPAHTPRARPAPVYQQDGAEEGEVQEIWESKERFQLITRPCVKDVACVAKMEGKGSRLDHARSR